MTAVGILIGLLASAVVAQVSVWVEDCLDAEHDEL